MFDVGRLDLGVGAVPNVTGSLCKSSCRQDYNYDDNTVLGMANYVYKGGSSTTVCSFWAQDWTHSLTVGNEPKSRKSSKANPETASPEPKNRKRSEASRQAFTGAWSPDAEPRLAPVSSGLRCFSYWALSSSA